MQAEEKSKTKMIPISQTVKKTTILKKKANSAAILKCKENQKGRDFCSNRKIRQIDSLTYEDR